MKILKRIFCRHNYEKVCFREEEQNNVRFSIVIKDEDEIVSFFSVTPKENTL